MSTRNRAASIIPVAVLAILAALVLLASCQKSPETAIQARAIKLEVLYGRQSDGIFRFEDRGVVCYVLAWGSYKGGISCVPLESVQ